MTEKVKQLIADLNNSCNNILQEFSLRNEVQVTLCDSDYDLDGMVWVNEEIPVSLSDIIYMLKKGVAFDEYLKYWDYDLECRELGLHTINFRSWVMGAPRYQQSFFDRIRGLRKDLDELAEKSEEESKQF